MDLPAGELAGSLFILISSFTAALGVLSVLEDSVLILYTSESMALQSSSKSIVTSLFSSASNKDVSWALSSEK